MRFAVGSPPVDAAFDPDKDGWTQVKLPGPYALQATAIPIGVLTGILLILAWRLVPPERRPMTLPTLGIGHWEPLIVGPLFLGWLFVTVVFVHELLHCVGHPRLGLSSASYIGVWPTRFLFYAAYLGPIGKTRYLVLGLLPFAVLSLAPLVLCLFVDIDLGQLALPVIAVSVLNGMCSCGDLVLFPILCWQVPPKAILREHGWDTYWKIV